MRRPAQGRRAAASSSATACVGTTSASASRAARSITVRCQRTPRGVSVSGWVHGTASCTVTTSGVPAPGRGQGRGRVHARRPRGARARGRAPRPAVSGRRGSGSRRGPADPRHARGGDGSRCQAVQTRHGRPPAAPRSASAAASSRAYRPVPPGTGPRHCSSSDAQAESVPRRHQRRASRRRPAAARRGRARPRGARRRARTAPGRGRRRSGTAPPGSTAREAEDQGCLADARRRPGAMITRKPATQASGEDADAQQPRRRAARGSRPWTSAPKCRPEQHPGDDEQDASAAAAPPRTAGPASPGRRSSRNARRAPPRHDRRQQQDDQDRHGEEDPPVVAGAGPGWRTAGVTPATSSGGDQAQRDRQERRRGRLARRDLQVAGHAHLGDQRPDAAGQVLAELGEEEHPQARRPAGAVPLAGQQVAPDQAGQRRAGDAPAPGSARTRPGEIEPQGLGDLGRAAARGGRPSATTTASHEAVPQQRHPPRPLARRRCRGRTRPSSRRPVRRWPVTGWRRPASALGNRRMPLSPDLHRRRSRGTARAASTR